jgi:hypothetical protein
MCIVAFDGPGVRDMGLVGSDYYGPFVSYEEAKSFIELAEYECDPDSVPVVLEIENLGR